MYSFELKFFYQKILETGDLYFRLVMMLSGVDDLMVLLS